MSKPPSRVVFVGNIPYGLSEEQISDIFSSAGKVLNFRLVYDRETGRPKGFGFAEYPDNDSAASAVRNLNDYEIMGRKLRVDFSNEGGSDDNNDSHGHVRIEIQPDGGNPSHASNGYNPVAPPMQSSTLPPLPAGKELPPNVTATDAISRTLNTLPPSQLLDILTQMKALASTDPARATELLQQAPQLAYAVFQALLLMGLVSPEAIHSVIEPGGAPQAPYGAPPPVAAPLGQDPDALMRQVMELPMETINMLPEAERQQILALRASFGGQRR
ncbi:hinge domain of cleavage stimulation factor subunit 2-domain-containing protein [Colletotrichum acutatum]|uniref:Hinge domain of cleavage stimulation factor subunit 2-domain-containing protein n=1 Tax=Glomerella acutata TaxID=27357 RepID=A0AAD9D1V8_GLOAC|nr:hinge domain of cleavage stimulation factor subunit 2-domain-containing protein [Colletotrichum acutatum]KAK1730898.1 hinge domain of cleavage stimulation factor subunit 2-domain-containing protein [Colletotrichum acutatum]